MQFTALCWEPLAIRSIKTLQLKYSASAHVTHCCTVELRLKAWWGTMQRTSSYALCIIGISDFYAQQFEQLCLCQYQTCDMYDLVGGKVILAEIWGRLFNICYTTSLLLAEAKNEVSQQSQSSQTISPSFIMY